MGRPVLERRSSLKKKGELGEAQAASSADQRGDPPSAGKLVL